jgi:hypothetical protein
MKLWGGQAAAMAQSPQSWAEYKARMAANRCAELTSQQLALWAQQTAQQTAIAAHNAKVNADPCYGFKSAREALLGTITRYQADIAKPLASNDANVREYVLRDYQRYVDKVMVQVADMDAAATRMGCRFSKEVSSDAGKGIANEHSLIEAIDYAERLAGGISSATKQGQNLGEPRSA